MISTKKNYNQENRVLTIITMSDCWSNFTQLQKAYFIKQQQNSTGSLKQILSCAQLKKTYFVKLHWGTNLTYTVHRAPEKEEGSSENGATPQLTKYHVMPYSGECING